jgi:hypothetical protein
MVSERSGGSPRWAGARADLARVVIVCSVPLLWACGEGGATASSSAPGASTTAPTGPASSSARSLQIAAADVDEKVVLALKSVVTCPAEEDGNAKSDCKAVEDLRSLLGEYEDGDDEQKTKQKKLVASCASLWKHESATVRTEAVGCVAGDTEGLGDPRAALGELVRSVESEPKQAVRIVQYELINELDPTKLGAAADVVALATRLAAKERNWEVRDLLQALTPELPTTEPSDEAFAFALGVAAKPRDFDTLQASVALLAQKKSKAAEVCPALGGVVTSQPNYWVTAANGIATVGGCPTENDKVIARAVEVLSKKDFQLGLIHVDALTRFTWNAKLSESQKAKLRAALEPAVKASKHPEIKAPGDKLLKTPGLAAP